MYNLPTFADGAAFDPVQIVPLYDYFTITQTSPWEVTITGVFNISVDATDFEISDEIYEISTTVSIFGLEDPVYGAHADPAAGYSRNFTNYTRLLNEWDFDTLESILDSSAYFHNERGPCFLMRLENLSESPLFSDYCTENAGIESFVHPQTVRLSGSAFEAFNDTANRRSYVDSSFFYDSYVACHLQKDPELYLYSILGISDVSATEDFRLDFNSTAQYLGTDLGLGFSYLACGDGKTLGGLEGVIS